MEAPKITSRKRKSPSCASSSHSNPFAGILTRHKSQKFFFHHNRSGSSRKSRAFPSSLTNPNLPIHQKLPKCNIRDVIDEDEDDEIYHITIKDLRARRVFSKPPKSEVVDKGSDGKVGKIVNPKFDSELIFSKLDESVSKSDENSTLIEIPISPENGICDLYKGADFNVGNPNFSLLDKVSDSGRVDAKYADSNLSVLEKCGDFGFGSNEDCNEGNPNLSMSDIYVDSRADCEEDDSIGGNPILSVSGKCIDSSVNCEENDSNGENPDLSMSKKCADSRVNGGNPNLPIENFGAKDESGGEVSDVMSPNLSSKDLQCRNGEDCEENVQTTPPDAIASVRQSDDQSVLLTRSADTKLPSKKISPCKGGSAEGKKSFPNSRRNLVLNPCSRLKVFKAPNSFSYRRMLPFLMDLAKDGQSAPKVNPSIKSETDMEEQPLIPSFQESVDDQPKLDEKPLATAVDCNSQEMNTDGKEEEKLYLVPMIDHSKSDNSSAEQTVSCTTIDGSLVMNQANPVSDESQIGTSVSDDHNIGGSSPDKQISLYNVGNLGDISPVNLAATLHIPKSSPQFSEEEATLNTPSHDSPSAGRECREAQTEIESNECLMSVFHNSPKMEAVVSSDVPSCGLAKGILKRNPRGCRGICNCLNCTSFRLNAERAFEFSRNQWLDANELATDLMKELSNLRFILEKSVNEANDNAIVSVDQVQEICRRVSNAEDNARSRLSQMSDDLQVHSRIKPLERPRVTFSSSVQKRIMGKK